MKEAFIDNGKVRLHVTYFDEPHTDALPLVFIPGMVEAGEAYARELEGMLDRPAYFLSLRARGKSDAPQEGYSFSDHVTDITALVDHFDLHEFGLIGHSVGAAYALQYAADNKDRIRGLIIGDYGPGYPKFSPEWVENVANRPEKPMPVHAVHAIANESELTHLAPLLPELEFPVWILQAGVDSLIPDHGVEMFQKIIPRCTARRLDPNDHRLFAPDKQLYVETIREFGNSLQT